MEILPGVHWVEGVNANPYLLACVDGKLVIVDAFLRYAWRREENLRIRVYENE